MRFVYLLTQSQNSRTQKTMDEQSLDRHLDKFLTRIYRHENMRRLTFKSWPAHHINWEVLAGAGFYYIYRNDTVRCYMCRITISDWEPSDNPMTKHSHPFWSCRQALSWHSENIRINPSRPLNFNLNLSIPINNNLDLVAPIPIHDSTITCRICFNFEIDIVIHPCNHLVTCSFCIFELEKCPMCRTIIKSKTTINFSYFSINRCFGPIPPPINHIVHQTEQRRLFTFEKFPYPNFNHKAFSEVGFYYIGITDIICCFRCGLLLFDLEPWDNPLMLHKQINPFCTFVNKKYPNSNPNSILPIINTNNPINSCVITYRPHDTFPDPTGDTRLLCKKCFNNTADILTLPCKHVAMCSKCVGRSNSCMACKTDIKNIKKIWYA